MSTSWGVARRATEDTIVNCPHYADTCSHSKKSPFVHQVLELVALILNCKMKQGLRHKGPPHLTQKAVLCGIGQCLFGSSTCDGATRIVPVIMQGNRNNSFSCASHSTRRANTGAQEMHLRKQCTLHIEAIYLALGQPEFGWECQYSWCRSSRPCMQGSRACCRAQCPPECVVKRPSPSQ